MSAPIDVGVVIPGGLQGDRHNHDKHDTPLQAISLLDIEDCHDLQREGYAVDAGSTGENITCRNLSIDDLAIGDRLHFSGGVVLELTKKPRGLILVTGPTRSPPHPSRFLMAHAPWLMPRINGPTPAPSSAADAPRAWARPSTT